MKRTQHAGSFLVVEGANDKNLLKRFVDSTMCKVEIAHGGPNLVDGVASLASSGTPGVLGIADADAQRQLQLCIDDNYTCARERPL